MIVISKTLSHQYLNTQTAITLNKTFFKDLCALPVILENTFQDTCNLHKNEHSKRRRVLIVFVFYNFLLCTSNNSHGQMIETVTMHCI